MIADELIAIGNFMAAMCDPDNGNELRVNAENADYIICVLCDMADRIRIMECAQSPAAPAADAPVCEGNVISLANFKTTHPKRKKLP